MSRPLQRGSRRVSDGGNPSDLQRDDKHEKEGANRARSLGSKLEITSLLKLWYRRSSLNLSEDHGKANLEEESRSGSDLCGQPLPSKRLESGASFLILKSGLVVVFLLALCWSLWWTLAISSIPTVSFYRNYRRLQEQVREDFSDIGELSLGLTKVRELDFCPPELEDNVPCFNASAISQEGSTESEQFDRLCNLNSNQSCLILPPKDYRIPLRWPTGRDVIWSMNVKITAEEVASSRSLTRRMMMLEDNQISFGSETLFVDGIEDYSHQIAEMIGLPNESYLVNAGVRTVLDIGCGYGSFGAYLFSKELLTLCIANYEVSGSQVQLTLERGLPAIIGSFGLKQLPYPFLSFDMVHCARCGVEWDQKGGSFLIEADRVLKPGGYFVWTSPVTNPHRSVHDKENLKKWNFVRDFAENLCWDLLSQQDETVVWKKTSKIDCYTSRKPGTHPSVCTRGYDIEYPYYRPPVSCIGGTQSARWVPIEERTAWPSRAKLNSTELSLYGVHKEDFDEEDISWDLMVHNYWSLLSPLVFSDHPKRPGDEDPSPPFNMLRNVMDMNAHFGGFNAALLDTGKSVWVMNVVHVGNPNYLPLILDRGFIGVLHDWCEPFPTYPRTYDMLHAYGLFSPEIVLEHKCSVFDIFLEMDRILRPEGWVILRDKNANIDIARSVATQLKWDARMVTVESNNEERLLICQKPFIKRQSV